LAVFFLAVFFTAFLAAFFFLATVRPPLLRFDSESMSWCGECQHFACLTHIQASP
jgi:hypothetical protein